MNLNVWRQRAQESREAIGGGLWGAGISLLVSATLIEGGLADYHGLRSLGASLMMFALLASLAQRFRKGAPISP